MKLIITVFISAHLLGCAANEVKSPCGYEGRFCGTKIHINQ